MQGIAVIENAKVLNLVEKKNEDGSIVWNEIVFMSGSDVNTLTINRNVSETLTIDETYDLILEITEVLKAYKNGNGAFKTHKFRIVGVYET